jgi:hypothetical protein
VPALVASDLHLGSQLATDVLRAPALRARLLAEAERAGEVVLLGDALELRQLPVAHVLEAAGPFFEELGEAVGRGGRVVLVPGNHDHALAAPLVERGRHRTGSPPLGLEASAKPGRTGPLAQLARRMPGVELTLSYPGTWVRPGVYAIHGHYLDCHTTVPRLEVLAVAGVRRIVGSVPDAATPSDYERVLGPVYAFAYELAQAARPGRAPAGANASARVWTQLNAGGRGRRRALRAHALTRLAIPLAVRGLNRAGLGPLTPDVSGRALYQAGLEAIGAVVERLGIDAEHVVFGHTHRTGPLPGDDAAAWRTPGGARLLNTGSWLYEPALVAGGSPDHPYWPGGCAIVPDDGGPPRLLRLLGDATHAELGG